MSRIKINKKAFTLVEVLVVVSIMAILSGSAVVGFGTLGDRLILRQVGGEIGDVVIRLQGELLMEKYEKTTLYFQPYSLVAISEPHLAEPILEWSAEKEASCTGNTHAVSSLKAGSLLIQKDQQQIEVKDVIAGQLTCLDFKGSKDLTWQISLQTETALSPVIRFINFNLDTQDPDPALLGVNDLSLALEGPQARRALLQGTLVMKEPVELKLKKSQSGSVYSFSIQP